MFHEVWETSYDSEGRELWGRSGTIKNGLRLKLVRLPNNITLSDLYMAVSRLGRCEHLLSQNVSTSTHSTCLLSAPFLRSSSLHQRVHHSTPLFSGV